MSIIRRCTFAGPGRLATALSAALIAATLFAASCARSSEWDERLEGYLPLAAPFLLEVPEPSSGVSSVRTENGEVALHLTDLTNYSRHGRINRGNWPDALGYTAHMRVRFGYASVEVMAVQLNDGYASGRFALAYQNGKLRIKTGSPDPGQATEFALAVNEWIELWLKVSQQRFTLYRWTQGAWAVASQGAAPAVPGAVYIGSASSSGEGVMDVDFFRLKRSGARTPSEPDAPCGNPSTEVSVRPVAPFVLLGQQGQIEVAPTERGVLYQLKSGEQVVGAPVEGNSGALVLNTEPLAQDTVFRVEAIATSGAACRADIPGEASLRVVRQTARIAQAKDEPDGAAVELLAKTVSASLGHSYWVQEGDRASGIRVLSGNMPPAGTVASIRGLLSSEAGERRIDPFSEVFEALAEPPRPLLMSNRSVGGSLGQVVAQNNPGSGGPDNIGLLAGVWGKAGDAGEGYYQIDDGSVPASDGTDGGLRVIGPLVDPEPWNIRQVVGPISTFAGSDGSPRPSVVELPADCDAPNPNLPVTADRSALCKGASTNIKVSATQTGVVYQLRRDPAYQNIGQAVSGTGGTISLPTGGINETSTFDVLATRAGSACSVRLNTKRTISVPPPPDPLLRVYAAGNPVDAGGSTTIGVDLSEVGVNYQLRANGVAVGAPKPGNQATIQLPTGPIAADTVFSVRAMRTSTACYNDLATSVLVKVNDPAAPYSKVGLHVVCGPRPGYLELLKKCSDALHPVRMIKCVDDFTPAYEAKQVNKYTLTVGRINEANGNDLGGLDYRYTGGYTAQETAAWYYSLVKPTWQMNPHIDVWEACNEWSWYWAYQADFYIALMDLAEADGFKVALWSCSVGNPPEEYYPDIARACARAAAHGGHMLSLHEYGLWPPPGQQYALLSNAGPDLVTRYRRLYNYLAQHNAVIPLLLTEVGQEGGYDFIGTQLFMQDYMWYDLEMKKDPYVVGCAAWILGDCGWGKSSFAEALPALADYISTH